MRYFYSDPLAAAWMAKYFGMFYIDDYAFIKYSVGQAIAEDDGYVAEKIYIHCDSLHLLEPQVDDMGIDENSYEKGREYNVPAKIIFRNNIPFMWPESEE